MCCSKTAWRQEKDVCGVSFADYVSMMHQSFFWLLCSHWTLDFVELYNLSQLLWVFSLWTIEKVLNGTFTLENYSIAVTSLFMATRSVCAGCICNLSVGIDSLALSDPMIASAEQTNTALLTTFVESELQSLLQFHRVIFQKISFVEQELCVCVCSGVIFSAGTRMYFSSFSRCCVGPLCCDDASNKLWSLLLDVSLQAFFSWKSKSGRVTVDTIPQWGLVTRKVWYWKCFKHIRPQIAANENKNWRVF